MTRLGDSHLRRFRNLKKYKIGILLIVSVIALVYVSPLLWTFITSIRPTWDIYKFPPSVIPGAVTLENYVYVVTQMEGFGRYFLNSAVVTGVTVVIVVISSAMGGYAFGIRRFKGQNFLFMAVISVLTIPYILSLIHI